MSGLEFPVALNKIGVFEKKNDISVNVLGVEGQKLYPLRKSKYSSQKHVDLLLITDGDKWHYTVIKNMSRLYRSSNSKHVHEQHICLNCLQGFHSEKSRDNHFEYCKDNEAVRIKMPEKRFICRVSRWAEPIQGSICHVCRLRVYSHAN